MKICSKCKTDKPDDQYYTYFHSSHKKYYTRGVCQDCMKLQAKQVKLRIKERKQLLKDERKKMIELLTEENKVATIVPELIVEDFSINPDYKRCKMCEEYVAITEYYQNKQTGYYHSRCKPCHLKYSSGKLVNYYQEKYRTRGGSEKVMRKAGEFTDIYQEEQVTWLLNLIGWSNDGGVWVKEGIKKVVDGKIVWDKIPTVVKTRKGMTLKCKRTYDVERIIDLRRKGLTLLEIAQINGCSKPTIRKILNQANEK